MRIYVYYRHRNTGKVSTDEYRSLRGILRATSRRVARVTRTYNLEALAHKKVIIADQKGVSYEDVASVIAYAPLIWSNDYDSFHPDRHTNLADECINRALKMKAVEGIVLANDAMIKALSPLIRNFDVNPSLKFEDRGGIEFPLIHSKFPTNKADDVFNSFQYKATVHAIYERYGVSVESTDNDTIPPGGSRGWCNMYVLAPQLTRR